jgi:hypothetical protein
VARRGELEPAARLSEALSAVDDPTVALVDVRHLLRAGRIAIPIIR